MTTEPQQSWQRFLARYEPLRTELYRYCRYLTRTPWDAEDLVQDALARAFVMLAQMGTEPDHPRAWLFRVASNLWIDQMRKRRESQGEAPEVAVASEPRAPREAAGTLLVKLSPQERAAVVLKDVFELSLEETADALGTTVGGIKAALHRGRGKLVDETPPDAATVPAPGVLDAFVRAFNAGDLDRLTTLLLDNAVVEVVGATTLYGVEAARRTVLPGMLFGHRRMADGTAPFAAELTAGVLADAPRIEARWHRDRWLLVHWYKHADGEAVRAITMVEVDGDGDAERIACLRNYFYTADFIAELGSELEVPTRSNGCRWWLS
jgi:RNA polymerase sigma-70 factor (ECF subfamily)